MILSTVQFETIRPNHQSESNRHRKGSDEMKNTNRPWFFALGFFALSAASSFDAAAGIQASKVSSDLSQATIADTAWSGAAEELVTLMAQPMALPRPKTTTTSAVKVQAIHNGEWIAFRLRWKSDSKNEAGVIGKFSDAVALQFPTKKGTPPPIFMGAKGNPVHIFHWRAQYQKDLEKGKPEMRDLYPNMNPDMYPMEFKDQGNVTGLTEEMREVYSPSKASGNPQSFGKPSAVDEILAEGFGTSAVIQNRQAIGRGEWKDGEWSVVITRPLKRENGSTLEVGENGFVALAVWQGGQQEAGSRKSVTMSWVPLTVSAK